MNARETLTSLGPPVPELPVQDVERAQRHYRDTFGFEIGWLYPGGDIGSVSRGAVVIFLRRKPPPFDPAVHWLFADDLDATFAEMQASGADIVAPLATMPWGLRQFTMKDLDGHLFHVHHD